MVQGGEDFGFALESGQALGISPDGLGQDLDRDLALEGRVRGAIDLRPSRPRRAARRFRLGPRRVPGDNGMCQG